MTALLKSTTDEIQAAQWDTCNDLVISRLHSNISDSIKQCILFINSACEVWTQLEKRFLLSNGSRKYKLNKDLFALRQNKMKVHDYFTTISSLWEEIESMTTLPVVTTVALDVTTFITAIETQKAESRLFQFLNGLDDTYATLRSQLLMQNPLPSVESAYSAVQQEDSQKYLFNVPELDVSAMYGKSQSENKGPACIFCGHKNHSSDRCWTVTGYPRWHRKYKPPQKSQNTPATSQLNKNVHHKQANSAVQGTSTGKDDVMFTSQQLQQLLKLLPKGAVDCEKAAHGSLTDDELEHCFSGMVTCHMSSVDSTSWIIDSGASDHMAFNLDRMTNVQPAPPDLIIKLPTGATFNITHIGDITLLNGLHLKRVLYVPQFRHNLLSIHKLSQDNNCVVNFHPAGCKIIDAQTHQTKAIGTLQHGLYYMKDSPFSLSINYAAKTSESEYALWHNRLGHAPLAKLRYILSLKSKLLPTDKVCITCPMSKFTKLPFQLSQSHATKKFALIHVDTWGPYKVAT